MKKKSTNKKKSKENLPKKKKMHKGVYPSDFFTGP